MKKLLLSSLVLLMFSSSLIIFQMSCSKVAEANVNNINQTNKIIFSKVNSLTDVSELWTANIDGTNQKKIQLNLPTNKEYAGEATITPDGSKIIFSVRDAPINGISPNSFYLYTANPDGTNITQIVGNGDKFWYALITAY